MTYTTILTETRGRVGIVILNRPKAMNAFNLQMLGELFDALDGFEKDQSVGAIIVTGNEKAFAAGADIKEMAESSYVEMLTSGHVQIWDRIRSIHKPVIAAVSGWALGGGCEFVLSCDMVVASESAKFGQPEITIGVIPGAGGTQRLARLVGKHLAMEMTINNRTLTAQEALQFGLANRVVPVEGYLDAAVAFADEIASRAPGELSSPRADATVALSRGRVESSAAVRRSASTLLSRLRRRSVSTARIASGSAPLLAVSPSCLM